MSQLRKAKDFLGTRTCWLIFFSACVGFFLFLVESSFVFVFQGFLRAIKLVEPSKLLLPSWYPTGLAAAVSLLIIFGILRSFCNFLKVYLGGVVFQAFLRTQRELVLRFGLTYAEKLNAHEVINIYTERVGQSAHIVNLAAQLVLTFTTAFLLLLMGLRLAPLEMGLCVVFLGALLLPMRALNDKINLSGKGIAEESEVANRSLMDGLRHFFFLKIYNLIPQEIDRGVNSIRKYEEHYKKYYLMYSLKNAVPMAAGVFIISVVTYVSMRYLDTPSVKLISFFYIFMRLAQTAGESSGIFAEFRMQLPGLSRLYQWYKKAAFSRGDVVPLQTDRASETIFANEVSRGGIYLRVKDVSFSYTPEKPVLQNFDVSLKPGNVLVVQGESGAGKSTLLSLILGLHKPLRGEIFVNDFPVEKIRDPLSRFIAYVGPEPYLIPGTVRDNLIYGHPSGKEVPDEQIWEAIKKAQLFREIEALPEGLDEMLYEHTQLSTGQKQRLAIARAMLRDPRLLILDEASANLDGVTEQKFIEGIRDILPGLTTVIISHKSSFNAIATQRIELKKISV